MKKNKILIILLTFYLVLLPLLNIAYASNIDAFLPEEIRNLKFNMSVNEYKQYFPDSKPFIKNHNYVIYSLDIKKDALWNKAACVFDDDILTFFSLTVIETGNKLLNKHFLNIDTEACILIKKISKSFGKVNKKNIIENKDSDIYYEPLMIWENDTSVVQLSYTPRLILDNVTVPGISLTFSKTGIDYSRFYPQIITDDNANVSFDNLLSDEVKKALYNSDTK